MTNQSKYLVFGIIAGVVLFFFAIAVLFPAEAHASYNQIEKWCETEVSPTPEVTPEITPEVTPECDQDQCDPSPTPEPTATPSASVDVPTSDGLSDGKSDGLSSCPSCTQAPAVVVPSGPPATGHGGR